MKITSKTQILDNDQVKEMSRHLRGIFPQGADQVLSNGLIDSTVRMLSISQTFKEVRERTGKTIKETAKELNVPQYRLRAIETGKVKEILPEILRGYSKFLGIDEWCLQWAKKNKSLAIKFGMVEWKNK